MVVPLDSTDVENSCARVRAVQDYAVWILSNPQVEQVAERLDWAIMPLKIAQQAVSIVKNMTCTTRQAVFLLPRFGSLRGSTDYALQGKHHCAGQQSVARGDRHQGLRLHDAGAAAGLAYQCLLHTGLPCPFCLGCRTALHPKAPERGTDRLCRRTLCC